MNTNRREDLRVKKTKQAIRNAFKDMICDMDYEEMSIKELASRAQINRKTFYLHYQNLNDVMNELQDEIADTFIRRSVSYTNMKDIRDLIRLFFESAANMPLPHERLLCSGSYQNVFDNINKKIMQHRIADNRGAFGMEECAENLVFTYYGTNSIILYRQWVQDGKKLPLEQLIEVATELICNGMSSVVKDHARPLE